MKSAANTSSTSSKTPHKIASEYEEPVSGEVVKGVYLKFSGSERALNSTGTITVAGKEIWGAF